MECDGKEKTRRVLAVLTIVLVLVVGTVSSYSRSARDDNGYLRFDNSGFLSIQNQAGTTSDIYYTDMLEVVYITEPDFGVEDGGSVVDGVRLGRWNSALFGRYINCTEVDLQSCIRIETAEEVYVINHESEDATQALYNAMIKARDDLSAQAG